MAADLSVGGVRGWLGPGRGFGFGVERPVGLWVGRRVDARLELARETVPGWGSCA